MPCSSPSIVATVKLEGQTSTISTTAAYTPGAAGLFRISVFTEAAGTAGNGVSGTITYMDDEGHSGVGVLSSISGTVNAPTQQTTTFRSGASAINYSVNGVDAGVTSYNLYIVIEQLI